jgi:hypothetical protein
MQVACAGVVAEPGPLRHHRVIAGGGEVGQRREMLQEPLEVRDDRGYLGLLQHDFRQPDPIGAAWVLPGQVVATMVVEPVQQAGDEVAGLRFRRWRAAGGALVFQRGSHPWGGSTGLQ